jgi:hypothetical protein
VPVELVAEWPTSRPFSTDESVVLQRCFQLQSTLSFHGFLIPLQGPPLAAPRGVPAPKSPGSWRQSAWSRLDDPEDPSCGWPGDWQASPWPRRSLSGLGVAGSSRAPPEDSLLAEVPPTFMGFVTSKNAPRSASSVG